MSKPRVLVVDDDKDVLMLIATHFENAGAEVTSLEEAPKALELVQSEMNSDAPFNLIIVDIRMPEMNGNELTKAIRDTGFTGGIVAFTSTASGHGKRESNEAGIDRYLDKATLKKDLVQAIVNEYCSVAS